MGRVPARACAIASAGFDASIVTRKSGSGGGSAPHHSSRPAGVTRKAVAGNAGNSVGHPSKRIWMLRPSWARNRCVATGSLAST